VRRKLAIALAVAAAVLAGSSAEARAISLVRVGSFSAPVEVAAPAGERNRVFVAEQEGRIRILKGRRKLARPFLDIRSDVAAGGERGLLSVGFSPDYARDGRFYVYYTARDGDIRVEELRRSANPDRADRSSRRALLTIEHSRFPNHNGGHLEFGPDGLLYISVGDGGGAGDTLRSGQDLGTLLGKILRIDPRAAAGRPYGVPPSNPFVGRSDARPEVYAYGLRNPFRFSFDRATGDLAIGDVGQAQVEEVDFVRRGRGRGANFGWNRFEGTRRFSSGSAPGHVPPVLQLLHANGACSVIGGYVVRDRSLRGLYGRYVYGDHCLRRLRSARLRPGRASEKRVLGLSVRDLSSFGLDGRGRLYAVSLAGPVYRFTGP
jgi:glucose/arabinose dehydrogenase